MYWPGYGWPKLSDLTEERCSKLPFGCSFKEQCHQKLDPCSESYAFSPDKCEKDAACLWIPMKGAGPAGEGYCNSLMDQCERYSGDAKACGGVAFCEVKKKCEESTCDAGDQCCPQTKKETCTGVDGTVCSWEPSCHQLVDTCGPYYTKEMCDDREFCQWKPELPMPGMPMDFNSPGGYCYDLANDQCYDSDTTPEKCLTLRHPTGRQLCKSTPNCIDQCQECDTCLALLKEFDPFQAKKVTQIPWLIRSFCEAAGGRPEQCEGLYFVAKESPEIAFRPGAICQKVGMCDSEECLKAKGPAHFPAVAEMTVCSEPKGTMVECKDTGLAKITKGSVPSGGACLTNSHCANNMACDKEEDRASSQQDCKCQLKETARDPPWFPADVGTNSYTPYSGVCKDQCETILDKAAERMKDAGVCGPGLDACESGLTCRTDYPKKNGQDPCYYATCGLRSDGSRGLVQSPCSETGHGLCLPDKPALKSAQFTDDARYIEVALNTAAVDTTTKCDNIFDASSAQLLGKSWCRVRRETISIWIDAGAKVAPGNELKLDATSKRLVSREMGETFDPETGVTVLAPANPQAPEVYLEGPDRIGASCPGEPEMAITLFGDIVDDSGREPTIQWTVVNAPSAVRAHLDAMALAASTKGDGILRLQKFGAAPGDLDNPTIPAGTYRVKLKATNFLGKSAESTFDMVKDANAVPVVMLVGKSERKFTVAQGVEVNTDLKIESVCGDTGMQFEWKVLQPVGGSLGGAVALDKKDLIVPKLTTDLETGTAYKLQLTAKVTGSAQASAPVAVTLIPQASALVADVQGPSGGHPNDQALTLKADLSYDPDEPQTKKGMRFSWKCKRLVGSRSCYSGTYTPDSSSPTLEIAAKQLDGGASADVPEEYEFTVTVSKDSRSVQESFVAAVVRGELRLPAGEVTRGCRNPQNGICPVHNPSEDLTLSLNITDADRDIPTSIQWSSPEIDLEAPLPGGAGSVTRRTGTQSNNLVVDNSALESGGQYTFVASMERGGRKRRALLEVKMGSAKQQVQMNRTPFCPEGLECIEVEPKVGFPVGSDKATTFDLRAKNWKDVDLVEGEDLIYSFGLVLPDGTEKPLETYQAQEYKVSSLRAGNHTLFICAEDPYGERGCATSTVEVQQAVVEVSTAKLDDMAKKIEKLESIGDTKALMSSALESAATISAADNLGQDEPAGGTSEEAKAMDAKVKAQKDKLAKLALDNVDKSPDAALAIVE